MKTDSIHVIRLNVRKSSHRFSRRSKISSYEFLDKYEARRKVQQAS